MNPLWMVARTAATILLLTALYFVAGKLGLRLAFMNASVSAVWPPTGIALAALLLLGYRVWPGIFAGAFLVNLTTTGSLQTTLGIALGNTLEGLAGAYLVNRFAQGRHAFDHAPDVFMFAGLAGMASTAISATCGVTSLALGGYAAWTDIRSIWLTWWLGNAGGAILITPLIVLWWLNPRPDWTRNQIVEGALLLLLLAVIGQVVFGGWLPPVVEHYPLPYAFVPVLVWAAFRFGPRETATVLLLLAGLAAWGTLRGHGPFVGLTQDESLILLQTFMVLTAAITLALATLVADRRRTAAMRAQLAAIVESSDDAIISKTLEGKILSWNSAAERIFGYAADEIIGRPITLLIPPDRLDEGPTILRHLTRGERIEHFETLRQRKDGTLLDVSLMISPIKDAESAIIGVSTIVRDISERKRAEKTLEDTNRELVARIQDLEHQSCQIMLLSQLGELLQSCHTVEEVYAVIGTYAPQLFPDEPGFLGIMSESGSLVEAAVTWHPPLASKTDFQLDECWALRQARLHAVGETRAGPFCQHLDRPFPLGYLCVPIMAESETLGLLYVQSGLHAPTRAVRPTDLSDSSTQRMAQAMAQHIALAIANLKLRAVLRAQAIRDPLTGLFNRRYLTELLELELRRAQRSRYSVGVVMLDIDHFKRVNDTFGHQAGDMLLREFATLLKTNCRGGDIVARFGGEEFVLVLPAVSLEDATRRAETLREAAGDLQLVSDHQTLGPVTVSLGVAVFPNHGTTGEALIQKADSALYQAKQRGRNRVVSAESS
jgi:diguanylate cyclase (GGDEF)-like protein/PAS domain S-box-containing protein